jgi:fucose permease
MVLVLPLLWLAYGRDPIPQLDTPGAAAAAIGKEANPEDTAASVGPVAARSVPLPRIYWIYWSAILLATAIEYCIIFWAADYLEHASGLVKADAALAVSAFLGAELAGRGANSRLLRRLSEARMLNISLLVASLGFGLFWLAPAPLPAVTGLTLAGFGVAGLFPTINALALAAAPGRLVEANGRISLAIGVAILLLPLLLGRLADWAGIRISYGLVAVLLALAFVVIVIARRQPHLQE